MLAGRQSRYWLLTYFVLRTEKVVEHWDVMQEEIPARSTVSGNEMFSNPQSQDKQINR